MSEREFTTMCARCRKRAMAIAVIPYSVQYAYDGRKYEVVLADLSTPQCGNCGTIVLDHDAEVRVDLEFRKLVGIMTPSEIRNARIERGLTQQQLASLIGIAVETLSRWETGEQIQQRSLDKLLRLVFTSAESRTLLENNFQSSSTVGVAS